MLDTYIMNYVDPPDRTLVQRMEALAHANDIRTKRANFKRQMRAAASKEKSREYVVEAILDPPEYMDTMRVFDLLLATRGFGRTKTNKYLARVRVSPSKTLGGLSPRQRAEIAGAVRDGLD